MARRKGRSGCQSVRHGKVRGPKPRKKRASNISLLGPPGHVQTSRACSAMKKKPVDKALTISCLNKYVIAGQLSCWKDKGLLNVDPINPWLLNFWCLLLVGHHSGVNIRYGKKKTSFRQPTSRGPSPKKPGHVLARPS